MKIRLAFINILLIIFLLGCVNSSAPKKPMVQTYKVKLEPIHKTLFFTGTIQPLHERTMTSPVDAVVERMNFYYGQMVKKGDIIVTLNSAELQRQYNDILTDYLKAKDNFSVASAKFIGTKNLWGAGLLSKNNFLSEKSGLDTSRVTLMQARKKLTDLLEKMDEKDETLSNLSIAEFDKVRQALGQQHNLIHLRAPLDGVLLYPPKGIDEKAGRMAVGSPIKAGQVFGLVGDLRGISVEIDIPEIDINKIRPGMKASITGVALGTQTLAGELVSVNAQASNNGGNALPSFSAMVEVKKLDDNQRGRIKVGMSAAIALTVEGDNQLLVPIAAIQQDKGVSVVNVRAANGKESRQIVATGAAFADKVIIDSGLKPGDVVVYG